MKLERACTRRNFISQSAAVGAGALAASNFAAAAQKKASPIKVGLVGCGGRGTGACRQALQADPGARLVAMADMFSDRLEGSLERLQAIPAIKDKITVPEKNRFVGFEAFDELLASGVDVVLLATPPHFRPAHLSKAVDAGVHVFAEKPVAVDGPGIRSVLASCQLARKKKLSVVSGLCLRYSYGFQELVRRLHDGAIGDVLSLQANDYRGSIWYKERQPDWTDMHYQMRNWYYYTWLSGDFNVEQHVHFLDVCSWAKGAYPVKAIGMGGRHVRTAEKYGNIFDHHSIVYEYADGAKLYSNTRQMKGCKSNLSAEVQGSSGRARFSERRNGVTIDAKGKDLWVYRGESNDVYQTEHDELFASIRSQTKGGPKGRVNGPQVEIESSGEKGAESGYVYGEAAGGWMTPKDKLKPHKHFKDGEWNKYRVLAEGARIQTWINGQQISDLVDEEKLKTHPKGFIGLQVHSVRKGSGPYDVAWRNIQIRVIKKKK